MLRNNWFKVNPIFYFISLFSIYEFDCPSGTFRPSFKDLLFAWRFQRKKNPNKEQKWATTVKFRNMGQVIIIWRVDYVFSYYICRSQQLLIPTVYHEQNVLLRQPCSFSSLIVFSSNYATQS